MLKASQVRTKRAALEDESMSSTPASTIGWLPTTPTVCPPSRAKPQTMFCAQCGRYSMKSPSSTTWLMTSRMSYGCFGDAGRMLRSSSTMRFGSSAVGKCGGISWLLEGRKLSRYFTSSSTSSSDAPTKVATPDLEEWLRAPPSSSKVTSSPVTVLTTSGPVMNMCELSCTMKMKSVMAGE